MGHPLAPSIMQRLATTVATYLQMRFDITMVAYLDDWLMFSQSPIPVSEIITALQELKLTLNFNKSVLTPTTRMTYLTTNHPANHGVQPASHTACINRPCCFSTIPSPHSCICILAVLRHALATFSCKSPVIETLIG
jgi:hypothetical protein